MKPKHKFNNGNGATLCHQCGIIIEERFTDALFCQKCLMPKTFDGQMIYVLTGLPASGKSTWAKEKVKNESYTVIVSRDSIREMLKGHYTLFPFGSSMEVLVTEIENMAIISAYETGHDVIVDATNFRGLNRFEALESDSIPLRAKDDVQIVPVHFDTPVKTCILRDQDRDRPVGKNVILRMYRKYVQPKEKN